jgi:hypothetical protein
VSQLVSSISYSWVNSGTLIALTLAGKDERALIASSYVNTEFDLPHGDGDSRQGKKKSVEFTAS